MKMKYIFKMILLLTLFSCNGNINLKEKLLTKENEFWVVDDFSEIGHSYGYKFEKNKYSYYLIVDKEKLFRRFDNNVEGNFTINADSVINYYFEGKIILLNKDSCKIKLRNGKIQTLLKKKFIDYKSG